LIYLKDSFGFLGLVIAHLFPMRRVLTLKDKEIEMNALRVVRTSAMLVGLTIMTSSAAWSQALPLFAVLLGGSEVSATGQANAGDPNGSGAATVILTSAGICYSVAIQAIDTPTAAHIHEAFAGVNGPVRITLAIPATGNPGHVSGCVAIGEAIRNKLRNSPGKFYVNVHTIAFPDGALRGQLF
jgi:hypothetical protein